MLNLIVRKFSIFTNDHIPISKIIANEEKTIRLKMFFSFINFLFIGAHNIYFHNKNALTFPAENFMSFDDVHLI
jgi:hypothetical protein